MLLQTGSSVVGWAIGLGGVAFYCLVGGWGHWIYTRFRHTYTVTFLFFTAAFLFLVLEVQWAPNLPPRTPTC